MTTYTKAGRVLIIAGSDSGGGAGIQADIKTVTALGGYAMTAVTALTAQNTLGVEAIHEVPPDFIRHQMRMVLDDIGADCIKLGMLHNAAVITAVAETLASHAAGIPVVADPVMIAKGGAALLEADAVESLRQAILPRATILTPNSEEAAALAGMDVTTQDQAAEAAKLLATLGPEAVLLTGGHLETDKVIDLYCPGAGPVETFQHDRIDTPHTHGTGCTLASAIATGIAQGLDTRAAVIRARRYVLEAIKAAPGLGGGHGPLGHGHTVGEFG